jgi:protoporphyrinogen oxidase
LIERCIEDCIGVGLLRESDRIPVRNQVDMPYAYVVYDHVRKHNVELIRQWLLKRGILLAGRYSEWEYYNSDHAFIAGKKVAEAVRRSPILKESVYRISKGATSDGPGVAERATL